MSFWQRFSADAKSACQDMYSSWVLGDDAGKSARLTLVLHPTASGRLNLGMTFIEINGRAYVRSVSPHSAAAKAGVLPHDAVQYATIFRPEWVSRTNGHNDDDSVSVVSDSQPHSLAIRHVLDLESRGCRISYDELKRFLAEAIDPTQQSCFLSPTVARKKAVAAAAADKGWKGPPIPSNICVPVEVVTVNPTRGSDDDDENRNFSGLEPVIFVFRRTRQRKSALQSHLPVTFRLDDECDFAASLVKRLAPTADMEAPVPDTWEELVHDGTDWLLGQGSMLPPKKVKGDSRDTSEASVREDDPSIPYDDYERERSRKLAALRLRMAQETIPLDRTEDVEAATIRGMIQKAVGLAFVRASKIVLGVSLHGGSGIVIARLSDGTWSAPSAIGTWGLGLGLQFGLEVAEYIFILQTNEALDHFKKGGSFTVGGNMGLAVAGVGREAYGAASVSGHCGSTLTVKDDEYNDNDSREDNNSPQSLAIAPIVAYAKSQGLYIGVSLEGSRIFARDDINSRTYKFDAGRDLTAHDILSGHVATPPEAEELYAALHSVEFTHEMSCLPRPPECLRRDSAYAWHYDRSSLGSPKNVNDIMSFLSSLSKEEADACEAFETQFKKFMYGGVSVQRLLPDREGRYGRTGKERRTLWLMLPEVGSLRLGFVSKLSDGDVPVSNQSSTQRARRDDPSRLSGFDGDVHTVGSEDLTLDSALHTRDGSTVGPIRTGNVQLSSKHSVALTDVTVLSQEPNVPIRFKGEDKMEHLRVIFIEDVSGTSLLFLANNFREAELLVCGLKLLLERENVRLGVRGGVPVSTFGARNLEGAMSPSAARGYRDVPGPADAMARSRGRAKTRQKSGNSYSDTGDDSMSEQNTSTEQQLPEGRRAWGSVPGRNYMRGQAAAFSEADGKVFGEQGVPKYIHGKMMVKEISKNVLLPLPLPLCRVLLLDSTSPLIKKWEKDRGDKNFDKSRWAFPPATPRELERHASEHQLIASGSMCGAHRTTSFDRPRYGSIVRLSETHTVDADDSKHVVLVVTERNPRRGFSIQVRVILKAFKDTACEATVFAEVRPVGKDMSNQAAVHKAYMLVIDEIKLRYGTEGNGLIAGFSSVVEDMASATRSTCSSKGSMSRPFPRTDPIFEEKKSEGSEDSVKKQTRKSGLVSFEDMLKTGRNSPEPTVSYRAPTQNPLNQIPSTGKNIPTRPPTIAEENGFKVEKKSAVQAAEEKDPVLIEVKPLPKIRLSLMPAPREEDEDEYSSTSPVPVKPIKKKKRSSSRKKGSKRSPSKSPLS